MSRRAAVDAAVLAAALLLAGLALLAFARLAAGDHFPGSEDAAGHLYKATILVESLRSGHGVPVLFPGWYAGSESFRYWPHIPYFLLAVPLALDPADPGIAALWIIAAGLAGGGAGILLWRGRPGNLGWPLALLGAVLAALLADPLRVAFAEGNLPRVVANALFLPELAAALAVARANRWHPWRPPALVLVALAAITVLCHLMMAAAAGAAIMLVLVIARLGGRWTFLTWRRVVAIGGLIGIGTMLSGWWLVPSLSGGIAGTNGEAVRRGLLHYPAAQALDPLAATDLGTSTGRAVFYVGTALLLSAVAAIALRGRNGSGWPYLVAGVALVATTIDPFSLLYIKLPFANFLWPIRLQSVGQILMLLGLLLSAADVFRASRTTGAAVPAASRRAWPAGRGRPVAALLLGLVSLDTAGNLALLAPRPVPAETYAVERRLGLVPGWREATLDLGRLGSPPTLLFRQREQLYGWGIQGARNIVEIVDLNEAIERRLPTAVLAQLDWWGVDDAILDRADAPLEAALAERGFRPRGQNGELRHWGRPGAPRALRLDARVVAGVGRSARVWSPRFPQVLRSASEFIDDLSIAELGRYPALLLASPRWHDRARAEALVRDYAASGGRVVIELSDTPVERGDGTTTFLGVRAERIPFPAGGVTVDTGGASVALAPFDPGEGTWLATRYAGAIRPLATVPTADDPAAVVIGTAVDSERVVFVGMNLAYHGLLTADAAADTLIEQFTPLMRGRVLVAATIPLSDYVAAGNGYRFGITLDQAERVVVPIARQEAMTAWVDDAAWPIGTLDDAVALDLPAGSHLVRVEVAPGGNRILGFATTAAAALSLTAVLLVGPYRRRRRAALGSAAAGPISAGLGWRIAVQETRRTAVLSGPAPDGAAGATPEGAGRGPFAVVLVEVTNGGGLPAPFDPRLVALVDSRGRPFPLALAETAALAATVGDLPPGTAAEPGVTKLTAIAYLVPEAVRKVVLVAANEAATEEHR